MPDATSALPTTRPELAGSFGMVASTHWLASQTGMSVLERGGNAADAAVAAGFVLQVVEPHLNGPAGEAPILVDDPVSGRCSVVAGQGPVPQAATPAVFSDLGLDAVPGTGLLAATVPGAFGAWTTLLRTWGTWRLADVMAPALRLAVDGAPVLPRVSATISALTERFRQEWPTSGATYLSSGAAPAPWSRMRLTALAQTYARVLEQAQGPGRSREEEIDVARRAWYEGFVAEEIERFCAGQEWPDSSGRAHRGLLTAGDLAGWSTPVEQPLTWSTTVAGEQVQVCKCGPWSQGPVLLQQLAMLDALGVVGADLDGDGDRPAGELVHQLIEVQKLAFADREAWYGDPAATDVPVAGLLDAGYARQRAAQVQDRADHRLRPGRPGGREPVLPRLEDYDATGLPRAAAAGPSAGAGEGEPTLDRAEEATPRGERGDTCHLDVVDADGLMVSATPSGGWLQSSPVVPALGFPLGTRAQMVRLEPGLPSSLVPGRRPRTTLTPTMLRRDGQGWVALGTPGGDQQDQWSLLLVLRILARAGRGLPLQLQAAIDAPNLHTDHAPSSFAPRRATPGRAVLEDRWPAPLVADLRGRGHDVELVDGWSLGRLSAVARERSGPGESGWLRAAANPRGAQGYAVGR